jgi:hypothetical protein
MMKERVFFVSSLPSLYTKSSSPLNPCGALYTLTAL